MSLILTYATPNLCSDPFKRMLQDKQYLFNVCDKVQLFFAAFILNLHHWYLGKIFSIFPCSDLILYNLVEMTYCLSFNEDGTYYS